MPSGDECVSSVENDTVTMAYLIGFFMTQFPYAAAAARLGSDAARDLFSRLVRSPQGEGQRPEFLRGMVERRYGKRR